MQTNEIIKGSLGTIILKLLQENGSMYGYDISKEVKLRSDGKILIKEGSLYPALHKLLADGLVKTEEKSVGNRTRIYYSLTATGKKQITQRTQEMLSVMDTVRFLLTAKNSISHA